jgi:hypothetical protein
LERDIVRKDKTGLKVLLELKDGNVTVEIGVSVKTDQ